MGKKANNSKRSITSKDVAALAGVSQSTVSRVLSLESDASLISAETAERVRVAAKQLGYRPNPIARALRGERTYLMGLVVREIADPFFAGMIEVLNAKARAINYNMILSHVHSDPDEGLQMARVLDSRQCDGVILLGDLRNDEQFIQTVLTDKQPMVALCRGSKVTSLPAVNCDNRKGMQTLIDYLLGLGHKRLAFIHGGWIGDIRERLDTFLEYRDKKLEDTSFSWFQAELNSVEGGYRAMKQLLEMVPRPTAVLASDDSMAIGVLRATHEAGLRVPQDISITGFDDIELAKYTVPALTTVRQPIDEMAEKAIELMIAQIQGQKIQEEVRFIEMEPQLIVRNSTKEPPINHG
jgi:DNA-binding LacI/PurR family transcriptional regulator